MKRIIVRSGYFFLVIGVIVTSFLVYKQRKYSCDFAVMGVVKFGDGIGRQTIGIMDCLSRDYSIQHIKHNGVDRRDLPKKIEKIIDQKYKGKAHVLIFESPILEPPSSRFPELPKADVKIAYSMAESTRIPQNWVRILNHEFDAVAVPDEFLVEAYQNSGVKIPIFVLPLGMYLDPFLERAHIRTKPQDRPFVFGSLSTFLPRKNQAALIEAFAKAFGNDPNVQLILNGRAGENDYLQIMQETKKSFGLQNIMITNIALEQENYLEELESLDCYVSPSKGEGFSLQPREALALGIPSIVTDNTAQSKICRSGYVRSVPSQIPVTARYKVFKEWYDDLGLQFESEVDSLAEALLDVYENYDVYAAKAIESKHWIEQYRYDRLHDLYKTLILPRKIILSDHNTIEDGVIYTTSPKLKQQYEKVIAKQTPLRKILNSLIIKIAQ